MSARFLTCATLLPVLLRDETEPKTPVRSSYVMTNVCQARFEHAISWTQTRRDGQTSLQADDGRHGPGTAPQVGSFLSEPTAGLPCHPCDHQHPDGRAEMSLHIPRTTDAFLELPVLAYMV